MSCVTSLDIVFFESGRPPIASFVTLKILRRFRTLGIRLLRLIRWTLRARVRSSASERATDAAQRRAARAATGARDAEDARRRDRDEAARCRAAATRAAADVVDARDA